jgi:hypothetical protein
MTLLYVQSIVEYEILDSEVEIITSRIRIQISNTIHISIEKVKAQIYNQ